MYQPKHLKPWYEQINFEAAPGHNFDDYYVAIWRFFRCTPLERSNFKYIKEHLLDCGNPAGVIFPSFTDEVMMCRYYVMIHRDNEKALRMADMFAARIKLKGSLDPEGEKQIDVIHSQRQWKMATTETRASLCKEVGEPETSAANDAIPYSLIDLLSEAA